MSGTYTADPVSSFNILAQINGAQNPEEVVVLGGHSDSWDVGQGAIDDGGGLCILLLNTLIFRIVLFLGSCQRYSAAHS